MRVTEGMLVWERRLRSAGIGVIGVVHKPVRY